MGVKDTKDVFFVEVKDHTAIRRNMLQSLRDILDSLQKFHEFQQQKEVKTHKMGRLRELLRETNKLILHLKGSLPDIKVKKTHAKKAKKAETVQKADGAQRAAPKAEKPSPRQKSELDTLEEELAAIERKLSKLA